MNTNTAMTTPILQVEHLSMKFGGLVAIGDLSFSVKRGEITALIGPNGAGKTTVFNCITGFYKPTEGMIRLASKNGGEFLLERMADFQITAKAKVARTFQNIRLFSGMTTLENLLVAQHNKLMRASGYTVLGLLGIGNYHQASAESIDLAKHWLEKAELVDRADDPAGDLPYGAQRRLEIARAMCTGPELLCLDEPAAGLNPRESLALNTLLLDIKKTTGTSILLIEHDMSVVMQISDHVVVLEYGRKISDGDPDMVKTDPRVIAAYLGVDDEEVETVLTEVGDEGVIEKLGVIPRHDQAPNDSSSMLAGPMTETVVHGDGERVTVEKGASKSARSKAKPRTKAVAAKSSPGKAKTGKAPTAKPKATSTSSAKPAAKASKTAATTKTASTSQKPKAAAATAKATSRSSAVKAASPSRSSSKSPAKAAATTSAAKTAPTTRKTTAKPKVVAKPASKARATPTKPSPAGKEISNRLSAPRGGKADDLLVIKGVGPVNQKKLNEHGVFHFDQIAAWKKNDIVAAEVYLAFDGRIAREEWVKQAKVLAKQGSTPKAGKRGGRK